MNKVGVALVVALGVLVASFSTQAAVILRTDLTGKLIGADGVEVDGRMYSVDFREGTCVDLFNGCNESTDFTFDLNSAGMATRMLLDWVFTGTYDIDPSLTLGCEGSPCGVITPFAPPPHGCIECFGFVGAVNFAPSPSNFGVTSDQIVSGWMLPTADTTINDAVFAVWRATPSAVPEPATLALLGAGLLGFGVSRRR